MIKQFKPMLLVFAVCFAYLILTNSAATSVESQTAAGSENRESADLPFSGRIRERSEDLSESAILRAVGAPIIWDTGSLIFRKTSTGQQDCITDGTCLTRSSVLYNSVVESPSGQQPCPGYVGPANTTWAYGDVADWNKLRFQPLFTVIGCFPPGMVGIPMVVHLLSENIYLQVTFNFWQQGGSGFRYTRTTGPSAASGAARFDFDGDSKTDPSIFRPGAGEWWLLRSSDLGNAAFRFGTASDKLVPADYTGDGKTDIAFWRPETGQWFVLRSEDNSFYSVPFGTHGDIPAPGDFDGDGKADTAVFRPLTGTWFIRRSSDNDTVIQGFGNSEDRPVVADFDGDGMDDIAVYRATVSEWWLLGSTNGIVAYQFGETGDKTVPGDYTADGKADVAFWRPSTGEWFVLRSQDNSFFSVPFGLPSDIPTAGDYDGDGTTDISVFRPQDNNWFVLGSTSGYFQLVFGQKGDKPVPNSYVAQ